MVDLDILIHREASDKEMSDGGWEKTSPEDSYWYCKIGYLSSNYKAVISLLNLELIATHPLWYSIISAV
jgi:hypothetical protein